MHLGKTGKKDYLMAASGLYYFYTVVALAFDLPRFAREELFYSKVLGWLGVVLCGVGILVLLAALVSYGRSFRVGVDMDRPHKLATRGIFSRTRNPIYVAVGLSLIGQLLVCPNWVVLLYLIAGVWTIHRQVLREEAFMRQHYGRQFIEYCGRVRRYL